LKSNPIETPKSIKRIVQVNKTNLTLGLATLALSIVTASTAQAALINGVTVTTTMGNIFAGYDINNIVNGSGLPGNTPSLTGTHAAADTSNTWAGDLAVGNLITFNLNGTYSLAGFSLWNFNGNSNIGVKDVNVLSSTDGTNFTSVAGAPTQFAIGANAAPESPQQFSFAPVTASYVRFQILSNQNFTGTGNPAGLSEVQFNSASTTSVPEPLTILGTLAGLGGGAVLKRRLRGVNSKAE
jgi:F5/8 type C domain